MTLEQFLVRNNVKVASPSDDHYRQGWVHVCCPWCQDHGFHLGFPETGGGGRCFKCGKQSLAGTVGRLLGLPLPKALELLKDARLTRARTPYTAEQDPNAGIEMPPMPTGAETASKRNHPRHYAYLKKRGIDPHLAFDTMQCQCIGPVGEMPWSIVIPLHDPTGRRVSWQCRDITGLREKGKYKTAPGTPLTSLLYGLHLVPASQDRVIVVEGVTDVWAVGAGMSVATFGKDWSAAQVNLLADRFRKVVVLLDPDAMKQAMRLADALSVMGVQSTVVDLEKTFNGRFVDPGELDASAAGELVSFMFSI